MTTNHGLERVFPVRIAPAPDARTAHKESAPVMSYSCQACSRRKVKCDKAMPVCSTCRKTKLECVYQAPLSRQKRKRLTEEVFDKLARYERILHQHGLLDSDASPSAPSSADTPSSMSPFTLYWDNPPSAGSGRLVADEGKSRYINSNLWRNLDAEELESDPSEDEDDHEEEGFSYSDRPLDPVSHALLGSRQSLLSYHPSRTEAMLLWKTHITNVEPICRILHVPSTSHIMDTVSQRPEAASESDECLMFAVYHFAVFSMSNEDCVKHLGESRAVLRRRFHFAARQALVNAGFLKTTDLAVLQALVLFLIPCRFYYDSNTFWVLTGVALRIAQRLGLHRDGARINLPPFEVQMRRRLFYQLLPLEGIASQMCGTGLEIIPDSWDTQLPVNLDDDQIWPGMTDMPEEQQGATDMIFNLTRSCMGKYFAMAAKSSTNPGGSKFFQDFAQAEANINQAEREVEEKYIRYCDIVNPLHFLTIGMARSAITAMRLRIRLIKVKNGSATREEEREVLSLAQKILDTDAAAQSHPELARFKWHVKPLFLWGTWDSLIYILTSLWQRPELFDQYEVDEVWGKVVRLYRNHDEVMHSKRALHIAFRRLTIRAWEANSPSENFSGSVFIASFRESSKRQVDEAPASSTDTGAAGDQLGPDTFTIAVPEPATDGSIFLPSEDSQIQVDMSDWMFWDQLLKDFQAGGSPQDPLE